MVDEFNDIKNYHEFGNKQEAYFDAVKTNVPPDEQAKVFENPIVSRNSGEQVKDAKHSYKRDEGTKKSKTIDLEFFKKIISVMVVTVTTIPIVGLIITSTAILNMILLTPFSESISYEVEILDYDEHAEITLYNDFHSETIELFEGMNVGVFENLKPGMVYHVQISSGVGIKRSILYNEKIKTLKSGVNSVNFELIDQVLNIHIDYEDTVNRWQAFRIEFIEQVNYEETQEEMEPISYDLTLENDQVIELDHYLIENMMYLPYSYTLYGKLTDGEEIIFTGDVKLRDPEVFSVYLYEENEQAIIEGYLSDPFNELNALTLEFIKGDLIYAVNVTSDDFSTHYSEKSFSKLLDNTELVELLHNEELQVVVKRSDAIIYEDYVTLKQNEPQVFNVTIERYDETSLLINISYEDLDYIWSSFRIEFVNEDYTFSYDLNKSDSQYINISEDESIAFKASTFTYNLYGITYQNESALAYSGNIDITEEIQEFNYTLDINTEIENGTLSFDFTYNEDYQLYTSFRLDLITEGSNYLYFDIDVNGSNSILLEPDQLGLLSDGTITYKLMGITDTEILEIETGTIVFNVIVDEGTINSFTIDTVINANYQVLVTIDYDDPNSTFYQFKLVISNDNIGDVEFDLSIQDEQYINIPEEYIGSLTDITSTYTFYVNDEVSYNGSCIFTYDEGYVLNYLIFSEQISEENIIQVTRNETDVNETHPVLTLKMYNLSFDYEELFTLTDIETNIEVSPDNLKMYVYDGMSYDVLLDDKLLLSDDVTFTKSGSEITEAFFGDVEKDTSTVIFTTNYVDESGIFDKFILEFAIDGIGKIDLDVEANHEINIEPYLDLLMNVSTSYTIYGASDGHSAVFLYTDVVTLRYRPTISNVVINNVLDTNSTTIDMFIDDDYYLLDNLSIHFYNDQDFSIDIDLVHENNQTIEFTGVSVEDLVGYLMHYEIKAIRSGNYETVYVGDITFEKGEDPRLVQFNLSPLVSEDYHLNIDLDFIDTEGTWDSFVLLLRVENREATINLSTDSNQTPSFPDDMMEFLDPYYQYTYELYPMYPTGQGEMLIGGTINFIYDISPRLDSVTVYETITNNKITIDMDFTDRDGAWQSFKIEFTLNETSLEFALEAKETQEIELTNEQVTELLNSDDINFYIYAYDGEEYNIIYEGSAMFTK